MQISALEIDGLFGSFNHRIPVATQLETAEGGAEPTVTILHGRNGVGKTTGLKMMAGMMELDFTLFRQIPFRRAALRFNTEDSLTVERLAGERSSALKVSFRDHLVELHPDRPGAAAEDDHLKVAAFRDAFNAATESLTFELVDAERLNTSFGIPWRWQDLADQEMVDPSAEMGMGAAATAAVRRRLRREDPTPLASRVARFIADAQVDYRRYFSTTEPDLFPRIMARLAAPEAATHSLAQLKERLQTLMGQAEEDRQLGLEVEDWSYAALVAHLDSVQGTETEGYASTVLDAYAEFLESGTERRRLVAERLRTFERILSDFYVGKTVSVDPREGLIIKAPGGEALTERYLSSGEYHLLYLMVRALVSQRRGVVIAIDEPEMSMHIAWQRKLIRNLVACASKASPQFLFATHSPEVVADYRNALVEMSG